MALTRRSFIRNTCAATAGGLLTPVWARAQVTLGSLQIDTLSDGNLVLPGAMTLGQMPAEAAEIVARYGLPTDQFTPDCNVTLLRDGTNTVLFDVGAGPNFMPTAGKLLEALETLGVAPDEITHVLFTHAHPDHLWGVFDDFDEPLFMNATHMIGQAEFDYWMDSNTADSIGAERQSFAAGALRMLTMLADDYGIETFADGAEVLPGIAARMVDGHTPGHMAFHVQNGTEAVMITGDAIGNHHVGFERPDWKSGSDQDADRGAESRAMLLDQLAAEQMMMIGYHLPFPGIGRAERIGDGSYRFVAA